MGSPYKIVVLTIVVDGGGLGSVSVVVCVLLENKVHGVVRAV